MLTHRAAQAEVVGIRHLAFVLDLFAFKPNVRNPMLAAAVGAARHMQLSC